MSYERMFKAIVLGGLALTASCASATNTSEAGPEAAVDAQTAEAAADTFPHEGPVQLDAGVDGFPREGDVQMPEPPPDTFPHEGPVQLEPGPEPAPEAGAADTGDGGCFPRETAIAQDC